MEENPPHWTLGWTGITHRAEKEETAGGWPGWSSPAKGSHGSAALDAETEERTDHQLRRF